jgi:hypothetical protein
LGLTEGKTWIRICGTESEVSFGIVGQLESRESSRISTVDMYTGGSGCDYSSAFHSFRLRFCVFFFGLQGNAGLASGVDHDHFLHSRLQLMILTIDTKI